jgi:hypothetical protein
MTTKFHYVLYSVLDMAVLLGTALLDYIAGSQYTDQRSGDVYQCDVHMSHCMLTMQTSEGAHGVWKLKSKARNCLLLYYQDGLLITKLNQYY